MSNLPFNLKYKGAIAKKCSGVSGNYFSPRSVASHNRFLRSPMLKKEGEVTNKHENNH